MQFSLKLTCCVSSHINIASEIRHQRCRCFLDRPDNVCTSLCPHFSNGNTVTCWRFPNRICHGDYTGQHRIPSPHRCPGDSWSRNATKQVVQTSAFCTMMTSSNGKFSALLALCAGNSPVPVKSPHRGQWRGALMFSLICARINDWVNNREAADLRRYRGHYDVIVMHWLLRRTEACAQSLQFGKRIS